MKSEDFENPKSHRSYTFSAITQDDSELVILSDDFQSTTEDEPKKNK